MILVRCQYCAVVSFFLSKVLLWYFARASCMLRGTNVNINCFIIPVVRDEVSRQRMRQLI